jgi:hypothetical protein
MSNICSDSVEPEISEPLINSGLSTCEMKYFRSDHGSLGVE